mgnify:CR=1 FL=1
MNKTKEEIQYEPFGDEWKKEINKIPKGFIIDMLSKKGKEYNALTDQIKSMEKQAVLDLDTIVNQRAIIKSMEKLELVIGKLNAYESKLNNPLPTEDNT